MGGMFTGGGGGFDRWKTGGPFGGSLGSTGGLLGRWSSGQQQGLGNLFGGLDGGNTPGDQGWGMNPGPASQPFQPQQTVQAPGIGQDPMMGQRRGMPAPGQGGMAVAPSGFDFRSPGVGEQTFNAQQDKYTRPSASGQHQQQAAGKLAQRGAGEQFFQGVKGQAGAPTRSAEFSDQFQKQDAGLGQYYDRAKRRTTGDMNDQLAARGGYGSSAGMDQIGEAVSGLDAERANRESDFDLRQTQVGGQLANQADSQQLSKTMGYGNLANQAQQQQLARMGMGGQLAGQADQQRMAGLMAQQQAAMGAQGARQQRGQDYFNNVSSQTAQQQAFNQQAMQQMMMRDQQLMDASMGMQLGMGREALNQDYRAREQMSGDWGMLNDSYETYAGGGGGGGGGFMSMLGLG